MDFKNTTPDFQGWATKNDILCTDGRTIRRDAFKHNDGTIVPLVYNHNHNDSYNVLGKCKLENREDGVYCYGYFNDTENGQRTKLLVQHGDLDSLSIFANGLKQNGKDVVHGIIREVSLVLAGANPKAKIEYVMSHSEDGVDDEIYIRDVDNIELVAQHSDAEQEVADPIDTILGEEDSVVEHSEEEDVEALINSILGDMPEDIEHADKRTIGEIYNTLTDEQKTMVESVIGMAIEDYKDNKEDANMKHNVFDQDVDVTSENVISHSDMMAVIKDTNRFGSMRESALQHGINQIDYLFPDYKNMTNTPIFIQRDMSWVSRVMNGVHHTPFSRIKSLLADITEDEARAKGYIKGKQKKEEVFGLLKRTTDPQTVYKKQSMHRDDIIDITDFDVVAWLKTEMRMMLDEELARAILIGDGRLAGTDDKIDPTHIRPIVSDDALWTIQAKVKRTAGMTDNDRAKAIIKTVIKSRKDYKGSGNPVFFTTEDVLTDLLLIENGIGEIMYTVDKLKTALRVSDIVTVPVMEGQKGKDDAELIGVIVNLNDYNVGADKGGAVNMFDDFDIDYNKQKYLIETRMSGALIKPYSAIALTYEDVV